MQILSPISNSAIFLGILCFQSILLYSDQILYTIISE